MHVISSEAGAAGSRKLDLNVLDCTCDPEIGRRDRLTGSTKRSLCGVRGWSRLETAEAGRIY